MGCTTKCALLRRSGAAFHLRPGRLTSQNPSCSQIHWKRNSGRAIHGKPLRRRNAAATHFWLEYSTPSSDQLKFPFSPGWDTRLSSGRPRDSLKPSNCCSHLVIPPHPRSRDCSRNRGKAPSKLGGLIARYGDERPTKSGLPHLAVQRVLQQSLVRALTPILCFQTLRSF